MTAKIDSCMRIVGSAVPYSAQARKGRLGDFVAAMRHFQPFLWFNTVSPDPVGCLQSLRRTFPSFSNSGFPAEVSGNSAPTSFGDNIRAAADQPFRAWPPRVPQEAPVLAKTDYASLLTRATANAAVSAEGYRLDVSAMFRHIYGLPLNPETRASADGAKTPGAFGRCTCGVSVTECNGRGWLHNHALFAAGIPSWAFQAAAASGNPEILASLAEYVDACVSAELEPRVHVQSLLRRLFSFEPTRGPWLPVPPAGPAPSRPSAAPASGDRPMTPGGAAAAAAAEPGADQPAAASAASAPDDRTLRSFALFAQLCNERTNMHTAHGSRCHGGKTGVCGCAGCFPRPATVESLTRPLRLPLVRPADVVAPPLALHIDRRIFVTEPKRTLLPPFDDAGSAPDPGADGDPEDVGLLFSASQADEQAMYLEAVRQLSEAGSAAIAAGGSGRAAVLDALVALHDASRDGRAMDQAHVLTLVRALPAKHRAALDAALHVRNLKVTEFSPVISALRGCNTAIYLVSSGIAAQVSMLYTLKYITKDPVARSATSSLALQARKHIAEYPSVAKDTGEAVRTAQHWLARLLNAFNGMVRAGRAGGPRRCLHAYPSPARPARLSGRVLPDALLLGARWRRRRARHDGDRLAQRGVPPRVRARRHAGRRPRARLQLRSPDRLRRRRLSPGYCRAGRRRRRRRRRPRGACRRRRWSHRSSARGRRRRSRGHPRSAR